MTLLKNIIFITIFLLFSFKLSKGQETAWPGELAITETTITEDTSIEGVPITETVPVGWSEETTTEKTYGWSEETTTTRQEAPWYEGEITTTEDTPIEEVLVEEPVEEGSEGEEEGQIVEEPFGETATTVGETTTTEAPYEWSEETTTTETSYEWSEETITERSPGETENPEDPFEEDQPEEGGVVEEAPLECRNEIEEITVHGYIMTFNPCCVSSKTECDDTYEPVCFNKVSVENGEWTESYETVNNVCNACKGNSELSWYSNGKCPWENGDKRPCQKNRRLRNNN